MMAFAASLNCRPQLSRRLTASYLKQPTRADASEGGLLIAPANTGLRGRTRSLTAAHARTFPVGALFRRQPGLLAANRARSARRP